MGAAPFAELWPAWRDARVLALDEDLVVVDKPAGVPTRGDAPDASDALSRVRAHLAVRLGVAEEALYLAAPQHLARDTSGVLVLARRRAANAPLAAQFERQRARAIYHAVLRAPLARPLDGVPVRPLAHPTRIALGPTTRSAAELRAALDAAGATLTAPLHLATLLFTHPATGAEVRYTAPDPHALAHAHAAAAPSALRAAAEARYALAMHGETDAFRLVNDAGDGVPGVTVDRYGAFALVQCYEPLAPGARAALLDAALALGARGVYVKDRPRQSNTLGDADRAALAPPGPARGEAAPAEFVVREHGLAFRVRLGDGLSTGIFLDQRENRRRVRELARDRSVLNLFAYTAPFTVAAAAGGAARSVSVDASAGALAWAARNLEENRLASPLHALVTADVFGWLEGARARRDRYDLVVLDPPSYSTTKDGSRFSSASDYRALAALAMAVVAPGGALLACSNHRGIARAKLRRFLYEAARSIGRTISRARDLPDPADFPAPPGREPHLKSVLLTLP